MGGENVKRPSEAEPQEAVSAIVPAAPLQETKSARATITENFRKLHPKMVNVLSFQASIGHEQLGPVRQEDMMMIVAAGSTLISIKTRIYLAVFVGTLSLISFPHEGSACDDARSCLIGSFDDNPGQTSLWHAVEDTLRLGADEVLAGCLARGVKVLFTWDEASNEGSMRRADRSVPLCNFTWSPTTGRSATFTDLRGDAVEVIVSPTSEERSFQLRSCGNLMEDRGLPRDAADLRMTFVLGDDDGLVCLARSSEDIDR